MALIEKLLDLETPRIRPNHVFQGVLAEWATGNLTALQAREILAAHNGFNVADLLAADLNEAQAWVNLAPTGTTAGAKADRALWQIRQTYIIALMEIKAAGYDTPVPCRARIGLP